MKKIILINPPQSYPKDLEGEYQSYVPMGIACIGAVARATGFETKIIDCLEDETVTYTDETVIFGKSYDEIYEIIAEFQPSLIGISNSFTMFLDDANRLSNSLRKRYKDKLIFLGGVAPSLKKTALKSFNEGSYDFMVKGEGEETVRDLLIHYNEDTNSIDDIDTILGIYHVKNNELIENENRPFICDLSKLPQPAFDLLNLNKILSNKFYSRWRNNPENKLSIPVFTSRGCPYDCVFCSVHSQVGYRYRTYSEDYIIEYIKECKGKYNITHFHFEDDNLTLNKKRALSLFEKIIDLNITWDTPNGVRADSLDDELLSMMIKSGLVNISIAAESGDDFILDKVINKHLKTKDVEKAAALADKFDLPCIVFFVVGFPGEKMINIDKTIDFAKALTTKYGTINTIYVANPLPGTRLEDICLKNNYIQPNIPSEDYLKAIRINQKALIQTPDFSKKQIFDTVVKKLDLNEYSVHGACIPMFVRNEPAFINRAKRVFPRMNFDKQHVWKWDDK